MFEDEITVFHFDKDGNVKKINFKDVYFKKNKKVTVSNQNEKVNSEGIIRIPTENKLDINPNDYVIEGKIKENWNLKTFLKKYELFKIIEVSDDRRGTLQHYKLKVEE